MKNKPLMSLTLCALAATSACALEDTAPREVHRDVEREVNRELHRVMADLPVQLALGDQALAFAGRELEGERVVKGAP